ncbi:MAG: hypothetical protein KIT87_11705 [Anaerolineae bacterium]|nr:hypothetical protein [Anaerolineae bacterium]
MYSEPLPKISLLRLFAVIVGFGVVVWWAIGASGHGDPLWFWSPFDETPTAITLYYRGQVVEFTPGQKGFAELTQAFNQSFSRRNGWSTLGVSPESAADYRQREVALAVRYSHKVNIHTQYRYGPYAGLFLPLTGRHSETRPVWGLDGDELAAGAVHLDTVEPIVNALRQLGYAL